MNKITTVTPVYYINLEDNIVRNQNINKILSELGFQNVRKVHATDTRDEKLLEEYIEYIDEQSYEILKNNNGTGHRQFFEALTNGSIGCYLSHISIYNMIANGNEDIALIFEDDVNIDLPRDQFWEKMNKINIPHDAGIFLFNGAYYNHDGVYITLPNSAIRIERFTGLYCYMITRDTAKILRDNLLPIRYQLDSAISELATRIPINIYGYNLKDIMYHNTPKFGTNIQTLKCGKDCYMQSLEHFDARLLEMHGQDYEDYAILGVFLIAVISIFLFVIFSSSRAK